jgi:hypothetical protein
MYILDGIAYGDDQTPFIKAVEVRALDDYKLWLRFASGEEKIFDFEPYLKYPCFEPLKDKALFNRVYLNFGTAVWKDGEIDISPDCLFHEGVSAWEDEKIPSLSIREA